MQLRRSRAGCPGTFLHLQHPSPLAGHWRDCSPEGQKQRRDQTCVPWQSSQGRAGGRGDGLRLTLSGTGALVQAAISKLLLPLEKPEIESV